MKLDLDKLDAATLPEAIDMALDSELSDSEFWYASGIIAVCCTKAGVDLDHKVRDAVIAAAELWDRLGAEQALRELRGKL